MEYITAIFTFLQSAAGIGVLAAIIALDHALAAIPAVSANSTFQLITKVLDSVMSLFTKPAA